VEGCATTELPIPEAPAYIGRAPHLAVIDQTREMKVLHARPYSLPNELMPPDGVQRLAQLTICGAAARRTSDEPLGTCNYTSGSAQVYPAVHTFTIYETRTARTVLTFTIGGDDSVQRSCPYMMYFDPDGPTGVAQAVRQATLARRLQSIIFGPPR
jgi:hypothetical protein